MELWLEMHATSLDNEAGLASGWYDVALSRLGERQARELGERRRETGLVAVYCSTLRRSYETAQIAFQGTTVPVFRDARLRECHYGALTRKPVATIDALRSSAVDLAFPDGESYTDVVQRVRSWLLDAGTAHDQGPILVIGHRATCFALEHLCRGIELRDVVTSSWKWQPGWHYHVDSRILQACRSDRACFDYRT